MAADEEVVDHLSALPDDLVLHILSLLPPLYSTLLSFVSVRFRRLWMSIPDLELSGIDIHKRRNQNILSYALNNREKLGIIRRFHLSCFDLSTRPGDVHLLFPCLETLRLEFVSMEDGNTLSRLLSCCPRLQSFKIEYCSITSDEDPLLDERGYLYINSLHIEYEVKPGGGNGNGDSNRILSTASANIDVAWASHEAFNFLNSFSNILHNLEICNPQRVWFVNDDNEAMVFRNMTHLVVKCDDILYGDDYGVLSCFLECSPNLISLVLHEYKVDENGIDDLHNVSLSKLEEIGFHYFISEEKEAVKYFLRNASSLKKLVIWPYMRSSAEEIQVEAEILDEPRASPHCEIQFGTFA